MPPIHVEYSLNFTPLPEGCVNAGNEQRASQRNEQREQRKGGRGVEGEKWLSDGFKCLDLAGNSLERIQNVNIKAYNYDDCVVNVIECQLAYLSRTIPSSTSTTSSDTTSTTSTPTLQVVVPLPQQVQPFLSYTSPSDWFVYSSSPPTSSPTSSPPNLFTSCDLYSFPSGLMSLLTFPTLSSLSLFCSTVLELSFVPPSSSPKGGRMTPTPTVRRYPAVPVAINGVVECSDISPSPPSSAHPSLRGPPPVLDLHSSSLPSCPSLLFLVSGFGVGYGGCDGKCYIRTEVEGNGRCQRDRYLWCNCHGCCGLRDPEAYCKECAEGGGRRGGYR